MKKTLLLMIGILCLAVSVTACSDKPLQSESADAPPESVALEQTESKTIRPLPQTIELSALDNCTVAAAVEEGGIYLDDTGKARMKAVVYDYDRYDMADIAALSEGDIIELRGEEVTVTSVEREESGLVILNGGIEQGGWELFTEDAGVYFETGFDDIRTWKELGTVILPVNEEFIFTDTADLEKGEEVWYAGDFLQPELEVRYGFTPYNTTITIQNGEVVAMTRVFTP
ncbi:MAG: hypothetical protein ACI4JC_00400 [Faecalibacterium sp.]